MPAMSSSPMPRTALLVLNFGGPETVDDVESFLLELFSDRDVIRMPFGDILQRMLAHWIAPRRTREVLHQYEAIGGGSPLVAMSRRQLEGLADRLRDRGHGAVSLHLGMRYTEPTIESAVDAALATGAERLVCLALYPHYSMATTGSSFNVVARQLALHRRLAMDVRHVPAFYRQEGYLEALTDRVVQALRSADDEPRPHLLFSAHGVPASYLKRRRDPYVTQVQETVSLIMPRVEAGLGHAVPYTLAWQSKVGPMRWVAPSTETAIENLAGVGVKSLVVAPVSFVGDHLETLYEIDHSYRKQAHSLGIRSFCRVAALDEHPRFLDGLADAVGPFLAPRIHGLCERCLHPIKTSHYLKFKCRDCRYRFPLWRTASCGGV